MKINPVLWVAMVTKKNTTVIFKYCLHLVTDKVFHKSIKCEICEGVFPFPFLHFFRDLSTCNFFLNYNKLKKFNIDLGKTIINLHVLRSFHEEAIRDEYRKIIITVIKLKQFQAACYYYESIRWCNKVASFCVPFDELSTLLLNSVISFVFAASPDMFNVFTERS